MLLMGRSALGRCWSSPQATRVLPSTSLVRLHETMDTLNKATSGLEEDPYIWLEEVESEQSLEFARKTNEACLEALGNPETSSTGTYQRVLDVLQSSDRIPFVSQFGRDENGQAILFNFWKDANNPKGLWRRTTMESYKQEQGAEWETVLDVDALAEKDGIGWVWKGSRLLPRAFDDLSTCSGKRVERALLRLSRGGSDAVHIKEFDLVKGDFVTDDDNAFNLPEAKVSSI